MDELNKQPEESLERQMVALEAANEEQSREALAEEASVGTIDMADEEPTPIDAEAAVAAGVAADTAEAEVADKSAVATGLSAEEKAEVAGMEREALVVRLEKIYEEGLLPASRDLVALLRATYKDKTEAWKKALKERLATDTAEPAPGGDAAADGPDADSQAGEPIPAALDNSAQTDEWDERFRKISRLIKERHAREREARERLMAENLTRKKALLEELKQLIDSEQPLKQTYDAFNRLTETWKEIKPIAREEANNLWQTYHFLVEKFFDKVKMNHELRTLDQKRNLEEKIKLCEQAEALLLEESVAKASQALHALHLRWKEIGQVSLEMKDEIWERFKAASDKISARRKAYYDEVAAKMQQNLLAKTELCEKIEGIAAEMPKDAKGWQVLSKQAAEYLELWKSIGRTAPKDNDAIWARFKAGMEKFFADKKAFYQRMRDDLMHNYHLKIDLCVQAENIAEQRTDYKAATQDLLNLQKRWKEIGAVPHKHADKIWKRFRAACDRFFEGKEKEFSERKAHETENMEAKRQLIEEVRALTCETRGQLVQAVQDIQRRWTAIGFVPLKEKEKLYEAFRTAIDEKFADKNLKGVRKGIADTMAQVETEEDAAKLSNREVQAAAKKLMQLRADLNTWENNIGFLSRSKNADVLRREVERKIQKAKQEIALLEAKMKLIRKNG